MNRLPQYLLWQFIRSSLVFFGVAMTLIWLLFTLRLYDLVTVKGQSFFVLGVQAFLSCSFMAREILFITMAAGMAHTFNVLQSSKELHIIHITDRVRGVWVAVAAFALIGLVSITLIANVALPNARKIVSMRAAEIAAELVADTIRPGRFTEIADNVVVRIAGRAPDDSLIGFFADDYRGGIHRTYAAESAIIVKRDDEFLISLEDGVLTTSSTGGQLQSLGFDRYELSISGLTEIQERNASVKDTITPELLMKGDLSGEEVRIIAFRLAESWRMVAWIFAVATFMFYPHGRRTEWPLPTELIILTACYGDRMISNAMGANWPPGYFAGGALVALCAVFVVIWRYWAHRPRRRMVGTS